MATDSLVVPILGKLAGYDPVRVREDGEIVTSSLWISVDFGRRHDHVLGSLRSLIKDHTINLPDFREIEYLDGKGRSQPCMELTERGALIACPFIGGKRSREAQARLVDAFLTTRSRLRALQTTPVPTVAAAYSAPLLPQALVLFRHALDSMTELTQSQIEIKAVQVEQRAVLAETAHAVEQLSERLAIAEQTRPLRERPAGTESITYIRLRIRKMYGLPERVIDFVLRQSPDALKPFAMVKNQREEAEGSCYAVYCIKDVSAVFKRFVSECKRLTKCHVTHPYLRQPFKLGPCSDNPRLDSGQRSNVPWS